MYLNDIYVVPEARRQRHRAGADGGRGARLPRRRRPLRVLERARAQPAGRAFYRRIGAREEAVVTLSLQPDALGRLATEE